MIIDGGIFVIMVAIAVGTVFIAEIVRNGFMFKILGAFIFFALAVMMIAEYDVAFITTTSGGGLTEPLTDVKYLIGDGDPNTENYHSWIGWMFMALGLLWCALFLMDMLSGRGWGL